MQSQCHNVCDNPGLLMLLNGSETMSGFAIVGMLMVMVVSVVGELLQRCVGVLDHLPRNIGMILTEEVEAVGCHGCS